MVGLVLLWIGIWVPDEPEDVSSGEDLPEEFYSQWSKRCLAVFFSVMRAVILSLPSKSISVMQPTPGFYFYASGYFQYP